MMTRIVKDCFGTVISNLHKMKECVRCELLSECRSINWASLEDAPPPLVVRRPLPDHLKGEGTDAGETPGADAPV
jgi:hypothetical protein